MSGSDIPQDAKTENVLKTFFVSIISLINTFCFQFQSVYPSWPWSVLNVGIWDKESLEGFIQKNCGKSNVMN